MNQPSDFDRRFLELVLDIDKHINGYIDAYIGPENLKEDTAAEAARPAQQLQEDVAYLSETIPTADPARHAYLVALLRAVETTIQMLSGEDIPYMEEVQRIYDIMPQRVEEHLFLQAQNDLDTYLPGSGPLPKRFEAWRSQYNIPNEKLLPALHLINEETRRRTKTLIDLPDDETIDIKLVNDQPWSAYNWFKGDSRSLIEFNTDIPRSAFSLLPVLAHEGYPGHHTEGVIKEKKFWKQRAYGESAVMLLHSPAAVIAEGIAMTAVEIIFPDREHLHWTLDLLLPTIPMSAQESAEQLWLVQEAMLQMRWVSGNAAILFHTGQLSADQTVEYLQTYGLTTTDRAAKSLAFITHPLYRSYPFTYTEGYDLICSAAGTAGKKEVFLNCLTAQILPSQLMAQGAIQAEANLEQ